MFEGLTCEQTREKIHPNLVDEDAFKGTKAMPAYQDIVYHVKPMWTDATSTISSAAFA